MVTDLVSLSKVISLGYSSREIIKDFKKNKILFAGIAERLLYKKSFYSSLTEGIEYSPFILKADLLAEETLTLDGINSQAFLRGCIAPPAELATLLRRTITDKEIKSMGLNRLIVMHRPICPKFRNSPKFLFLSSDLQGKSLLGATGIRNKRTVGDGFVYLHNSQLPKKKT